MELDGNGKARAVAELSLAGDSGSCDWGPSFMSGCPLFWQSLSSTVTLEHSSLPPGIHISYESHCGDPKTDGEAGPRGQCSHVRVNQMVRGGPPGSRVAVELGWGAGAGGVVSKSGTSTPATGTGGRALRIGWLPLLFVQV